MKLVQRLVTMLKNPNMAKAPVAELNTIIAKRSGVTARSGAVLPEPRTQPYGFTRVICGVVIGVMVGATLSKNVANFLEENDLFVPSDDDDDD